MSKNTLNIAKMRKRISDCTDRIVVGQVYFLSTFYDKEGAMVKVVSKSKKRNRCGWNSSVVVEVVEPMFYDDDAHSQKYYAIGTTHTVNATNLYERRALASASNKWGQPIGL